MKKKLFLVYSVALICFNQFINALNVCASQAVADNPVQMELDSNQKYSSIDMDSLYPIDANSPKWEKLGTEEEKFEKTQIEPAVIKRMDTDTLLEAVLRSPMLYTVENSVDRECGAMTFLDKVNAGKELLERKDVKAAILKEYLSLEIPDKTLNDYSKINNCSDEDLYSTIMELLDDEEFSENLDKDIDIYYRIHFLEGAILSDDIYSALSAEEKRDLYHKSLILNAEKQKSEVFSYNEEESFTEALMADDELVENMAIPKIAQNVETTYVYVYTPRGTAVSAIKYSDNHKNSYEYVASYQKDNPTKKVVAPGYSRSNCHAYTWPGRRDVWMNNEGAFTTDGSYKKVNSGGRATANHQKVTTAGHSAVVVDYTKQNQRIRTKQGGSPVYECDLTVDFSGKYTIYQQVC